MSGGALILNSRQSLYPHGGLGWVQQTRAAVKWTRQSHLHLNALLNHPTWTLQLALAEMEGVPVKIINDSKENAQDAHFQLMNEAEIILPVSIRPCGMNASLLRESEFAAKVDTRFSIPYKKTGERLNHYPELRQSSSVALTLPVDPADYLFHWTRTARNGWPNESPQVNSLAILCSCEYPFTALNALRRILESRMLIASTRHMRASVRVVSFTGRHPDEMLRLMRWRRRYRELSFEPYAVGVHRDWAGQAGVCPVAYVRGKQNSQTNIESEFPNWLLQGSGKDDHWIPEDEYRALGDLRLPVHYPEIIAITYRRSEAELLSAQSQLLCGYFIDD